MVQKHKLVTAGYSTMKNMDFYSLVSRVIHMMAKNGEYFPRFNPWREEVEYLGREYLKKFIIASGNGAGGRAIKARNEAHKLLAPVLTQLARWYNTEADGDRIKLLNTGFDTVKPPPPRKAPTGKLELKVFEADGVGTVRFHFSKVLHADY